MRRIEDCTVREHMQRRADDLPDECSTVLGVSVGVEIEQLPGEVIANNGFAKCPDGMVRPPNVIAVTLALVPRLCRSIVAARPVRPCEVCKRVPAAIPGKADHVLGPGVPLD